MHQHTSCQNALQQGLVAVMDRLERTVIYGLHSSMRLVVSAHYKSNSIDVVLSQESSLLDWATSVRGSSTCRQQQCPKRLPYSEPQDNMNKYGMRKEPFSESYMAGVTSSESEKVVHLGCMPNSTLR